MKLFASLSNRIFIAAALLAIATTGVAVYVVGVRTTREAESQLERGLNEAGALVEQQRRTLTSQYVLVARLLADLPKLKGAVETGDPLTVAPIAADYQRQVTADLLVVSGRSGEMLATTPPNATGPAHDAVARALAGQEVIEYRAVPGGVLQVTIVPISIGLDLPETLGALSVGVRLDTRMAERFKAATRSEVVFALNGRVHAATLPRSGWPQLEGLLHTKGVSQVTVGDSEYVGRAQPFAPRPGDTPPAVVSDTPSVLVLQSRTERLGFLRTVYAALALAAVAAVLLATGLSYAVARTITRPLGTITATMREVAATGDLTRKIPTRAPSPWQDEDARLLATTFNTLTDSIAKFQREAAQKERLLSLGRLSTVIAHEIRNPLMIIKAALRSLKPEAPPDDIREAVRDIDEEVDRLNRIVHDVLDFARPPRFVHEQADLVRLCRDAAAAVAVGSGPRIEIALPPSPLVASTDPERLRTALVNVLSNARQAVEARKRLDGAAGFNGVESAVHLALERRDTRHVRLRVTDHGTGIKADDLAQIFEPYFTTRRSGTGLGLPIARNIIEGLGGTISVDTAPGLTMIDIVLPTDAEQRDRDTESAKSDEVRRTEPGEPTRRTGPDEPNRNPMS